MKRRVFAQRNIPAPVRTWVREFKGEDVVGQYKDHCHVTWSCAVLELRKLGVSIPAEDLEKAYRHQIRRIECKEGRKWRKAEEIFQREFGVYIVDLDPQYGWLEFEQMSTSQTLPSNLCRSRDPISIGYAQDDYDPFAE